MVRGQLHTEQNQSCSPKYLPPMTNRDINRSQLTIDN